MKTFDTLIIGSGLAGMTMALELAASRKVALVSKRSLCEGASVWAQGGIAAVLDQVDSVDQHVSDTLIAGAGLCDESATRFIVEHSRDAIQWLIDLGVPFTTDPGHETGFHLTREGGHSQRRIIHAADATGAAVIATLAEQVRQHPNITILENHLAVDLITHHHLGEDQRRCAGAWVLDQASGETHTILAADTVLATGGAGKVYVFTSNPDTSTGDGIAMGWRAGCRVSNLEFIQFHPTCLYHPDAKSFLISEAVRGEGGLLKLPDGTRFMLQHDERAELAPRDIVARAIDFEMKRHGLDCVYLDISHQPADFIREHFPTIYSRCLELGIDITRDPIPVVPAAHYTCGGIVTGLDGSTDLPGLYAVGECACTGLHGANRLASNSLLECVVIGKSASAAIRQANRPLPTHAPDWDESRVTDADEEVVISHNWDELRRFMWDYVGIVRTDKRLERAANRIALLRREIDEFYSQFRISRDLIELRNLVDTADLIVRSAQLRKESRGLHCSLDYPEKQEQALPTLLPARTRH
ncbi:L-aspartate oxidase [Burkholderiaceae bacterium DAT-1]|nr:L-aspartate oxidase [Burkholderiaceae bacterium DAT-1]